MSNSANFFKLVAEFQRNIDWLNTVLLGDSNSTIIIDEVEKPSIDKAVKDKLDPVEADLLAKYAAIEKQINDNWDALDSDIQQKWLALNNDIDSKWAAISAITHGSRIVKETLTALQATTGNADQLAEVWNDPTEVNNGLYGWSGNAWLKSPYDVLTKIQKNSEDIAVNYRLAQASLFNATKEAANLFTNAINTTKYFTDERIIDSRKVNDPLLNQLGIYWIPEERQHAFMSNELHTNATGKWVTAGIISYSENGVFEDRGVWDRSSQEIGVTGSYKGPYTDYVQLTPTVRINYFIKQITSDFDTINVGVSFDNDDPRQLVADIFGAVSNTPLDWRQVDIFNIAFPIETSIKIQDLSGYKSAFDYEGMPHFSFAKATYTDIEEIRSIVPFGDCIEVVKEGSHQFIPKTMFEGDQQGKWFYNSFYVYSNDVKNIGGLAYFLNNDGQYVPAKPENQIRTTIDRLSERLYRITIRGSFYDKFTKYGLWSGIALNGLNSYFFGFAAGTHSEKLNGHPPVSPYFCPKSEPVYGAAVLNPLTVEHRWSGKKLVWLGTSIPAGAGYPEEVAKATGANLVNLSIGGGRLGAFNGEGIWPPQGDYNFCFTLKASEVQARVEHNLGKEVSPTNYQQEQVGSGVILTQDLIDELTYRNYEKHLAPHLDADVFVIDYGINDRNLNKGIWQKAIDADDTSRSTFASSVRFLVKYILEANPNAELLFLTHHNRGTFVEDDQTNQAVLSQLDCAEFLGIPCVKIHEELSMSIYNRPVLIPDNLHPPKGGIVANRYVVAVQ